MVISGRMVAERSGGTKGALASMSSDDALESAIGQPHARKHAARAAHRTDAATAQHRAVLPTQVATSNPDTARLRKTAKRRSAVKTFLNNSRPGYVATRMIGTSPPALRVAAWAVAASASIRTAHAACCKRTAVPRSPPNANVTARNAG